MPRLAATILISQEQAFVTRLYNKAVMVMSKLGMSDRELANYLAREPRSHTEFKVDLFLRHVVPSLLILRKLFLKIVPKWRAV